MYEFHGWMEISESAFESDTGTLAAGIDELRGILAALDWTSADATLLPLNGEFFLSVNGYPNRVRHERDELYALLDHVGRRFPGSYGLLYERADDGATDLQCDRFAVRVMRKGRIKVMSDPFLSPVFPLIEDETGEA